MRETEPMDADRDRQIGVYQAEHEAARVAIAQADEYELYLLAVHGRTAEIRRMAQARRSA